MQIVVETFQKNWLKWPKKFMYVVEDGLKLLKSNNKETYGFIPWYPSILFSRVLFFCLHRCNGQTRLQALPKTALISSTFEDLDLIVIIDVSAGLLLSLLWS